MAFIYEQVVDPEAENNAHAYMLRMVGFNKAVLEIGCASGHVTKVLVDRGCRVVGVEMDPEAARVAEAWAEEVIVGHVERDEVWDHLSAEKFDAVLFGDVLEHLEDPLTTLRTAVRFISPTGVVVMSIPNIAHGDVRLALFQGSFTYQDTGLLDRTHLHFFTKESIVELCRQAGLAVVEFERVVRPLFQSELGVIRDDFEQTTIDQILEDPEAEIYQFVVKAVLDNGDHALAKLADTVMELSDRAHHEVVRTALLREELRDRDQLAQQVKDFKVTLKERDQLALQVQWLKSNGWERDQLAQQERDLAQQERDQLAQQERDQLAQQERDQLAQQVRDLHADLRNCTMELDALLHSKTLRYLAPFRRLYGRLIELRWHRRAPATKP